MTHSGRSSNPFTVVNSLPEPQANPAADTARGAAVARLVDRWEAIDRFLVVGSICIVAGGLMAAVTRPSGFQLGSWVAAYLVLVGGVAQIALAAGQAWLADERPHQTAIRAELATWNIGVVATIAGTLLSAPIVTTFGGIMSIGALSLFLAGVRNARSGPQRIRVVYAVLIVIILVSTPVGLSLAWLRHG